MPFFVILFLNLFRILGCTEHTDLKFGFSTSKYLGGSGRKHFVCRPVIIYRTIHYIFSALTPGCTNENLPGLKVISAFSHLKFGQKIRSILWNFHCDSFDYFINNLHYISHFSWTKFRIWKRWHDFNIGHKAILRLCNPPKRLQLQFFIIEYRTKIMK